LRSSNHHPRALDRQHVVEQLAGEREMTEVVGAELELETVLGAGLFRVHHAGVVDQQVDTGEVGAQFVGGLANVVQRRQIQLLDGHDGVGTLRRDPFGGVVALVEVAHRQHHVCALVGEHGCGFVTDTGIGAGDDGDPTGLVRHVGRGPFGTHGLQHTQAGSCVAG
jgi:hypothetical protein